MKTRNSQRASTSSDDLTYLYKEMGLLRKHGHVKPVPSCISDNLNPKFALRPYQKEAFENFVTYFEGGETPKEKHVLFHMATGSGKTLIMAGLMLYLYSKGYHNFLFFVNLSYIVKKTKENFLNPSSSKYLFAKDGLSIDREFQNIIERKFPKIVEVPNFQNTNPGCINICFTTTQGLHTDLKPDMYRENRMTPADFEDQKIVMISDEAHHLNADTMSRRSKAEDLSYQSWQETIKNRLFPSNKDNVLLEFTATCNLKNDYIREYYMDKIICDYPLSKFYKDGYSKDILSLESNVSAMDKALQALVLSQYRLKVFQENRLNIKPIVLFKSAKIPDTRKFKEDFLNTIGNLDGKRLEKLSGLTAGNEILCRAYDYFSGHKISFDDLARELREDFSEEHCFSVNEEKEKEKELGEAQVLLNSLEDEGNPYRAIFEVKKLDEGWDVLNLFDIVRLYETRTPSDTISEAQLIGRGARYCPFCLGEDKELMYKRKYDRNVDDELRVCETLYYHCQKDSRYISELRDALREIGLDSREVLTREYVLKEKFTSDPLYKNGSIFVNDCDKIDTGRDVRSLPEDIRSEIYLYKEETGPVSDKLMEDYYLEEEDQPVVELKTTKMQIKEIAAINYAIVNRALMKEKMGFDKLKKSFPNLSSTREFIEDENYLGGIEITIQSRNEKPSVETLYDAVAYVLKGISKDILALKHEERRGQKEFHPQPICKTFQRKITLTYYTAPTEDGVGVSQKAVRQKPDGKDLYLDLSKEEWFAHTDFFGTPEEKALVKHFKYTYVEKLRSLGYETIFLVRNEGEFGIYSFDKGRRFEPDFVLFLRRGKGGGGKDGKTNNFEQIQIFIEPKGDGFIPGDEWKQEFLCRLKEEATLPVELISDGNDYKIWGVRFFNHNSIERKEFDKDFSNLLESNAVKYPPKDKINSTILIYSSKKQIGIKAKAAEDGKTAPSETDDKDKNKDPYGHSQLD